jgi:dipeptidyl aminopeptidase/acylaminoacyl peptidase
MRIDLKTGERRPLAASETSDEAAKLGEFERSAERRRKFTPPGNTFLEQRLLGESRKVEWIDDEGRRLEGVLTVPPAAVAEPPYKLVLFPHGGPHSRSSLGFNFTAQIFAAHGYAVFEPNFRGSAGYGRKFLDADRHDFGGGDMRDIQSGIESLIAQGLVDRKRQFVYGVSYGGYMTCWLVGHTGQFRAAVAQNAVTDLNVMWGLSDIQSWTEWEFGGKPWEVAEAMRTHSPLAYVEKVATPTLILHSRDDRRCPIAMGRMFYQALVARGVPTEMVVYPDEGHGIRQPRHREDVLRRTLAWFVRHDLQE